MKTKIFYPVLNSGRNNCSNFSKSTKIVNTSVLCFRFTGVENGVKKMRKIILLLLPLLLISYSSIIAQGVTKKGTTAAAFLGIDVGPRAVAMGSSYVSVANDVSAMYWNPAGISKIDNFNAEFSNTKWIADLSFNYAGIVFPLEGIGNFGLNVTFLTMDQIERTTIENPDGTGEMFDAASYAFGLSYAKNLTDQFSIGFNVKYINERLYHVSSDGFAADVGARFETGLEGLTLGMSISNYGTKMQLDGRDLNFQTDVAPNVSGNNQTIGAELQTDAYELPLMFRVGVSMDVLKGLGNSNLILSADALHPNDDREYVNVGGEYVFYDILSLRGGYKGLFAQNSEQGISLGGGVHYTLLESVTFYFDYSYIDFGRFNAIHMFSVGLGL
jgi:opacity protein-like surface antigen